VEMSLEGSWWERGALRLWKVFLCVRQLHFIWICAAPRQQLACPLRFGVGVKHQVRDEACGSEDHARGETVTESFLPTTTFKPMRLHLSITTKLLRSLPCTGWLASSTGHHPLKVAAGLILPQPIAERTDHRRAFRTVR
jgi:hypothetical protein